MKRILTAACLTLAAGPVLAQDHPLDGLSPDEYARVNTILRDAGVVTDQTLFPLVELKEPPKSEVLAWDGEAAIDRKALVHYTSQDGFSLAIVNLTTGEVEEDGLIEDQGQPMIMLTEFLGALEATLGDDRMIEALAKRDLTPDQVFCLPLTAGNFLTPEYEGNRLMKVPCYVVPSGSNFYAKPIEGLSATYDLRTSTVLEVVDTGVVDTPADPWGYTEEELAERAPLRAETSPARLGQPGGPNFTIEGGEVTGASGNSAPASTSAPVWWSPTSAWTTRAHGATSSTKRICPRSSCPTWTRTKTGIGAPTWTAANTASASS